MLTVFDGNTAALALYKRLGYTLDVSSPDSDEAADADLRGCSPPATCLLSALLFALRPLSAGFRHSVLSRLCFVSRTVRVCVAFLPGFSVAFLPEL